MMTPKSTERGTRISCAERICADSCNLKILTKYKKYDCSKIAKNRC